MIFRKILLPLPFISKNKPKYSSGKKLGVIVLFFATFTVAKLCVFGAPLLLSNLLNLEIYGTIEFALSLGAYLGIVFNYGTNASFPHLVIKRSKQGFIGAFYLHPILLSMIFLLLIFNIYCDRLSLSQSLPILIALGLSLQQFYSTILKSFSKPIFAVLLDSGLFIILTILCLCIYFKICYFSTLLMYLFIGGYLLLLFLISYLNFFRSKLSLKELFKKYQIILQFGLPTILSSFLVMTLTASGRVITEIFLPTSYVGIYSFYFRIAAIVVMLYQVVNILFFKKIYLSNSDELDKYISIFLFVILLLGVVCRILVPLLFYEHFSILKESYNENQNVYTYFVFQMVFWVSMTLNETFTYRENLSKTVNTYFIYIVLCYSVAIFTIDLFHTVSLIWIVITQTICLYLATECQFRVFKLESGIRFPKTRLVNFVTLLFLILSFLYSNILV
ncbi:hypothetical protein AAG747_29005 [Rapidithrix thailandica]|uniref:Polysaccharide biosynthesis protein n=1 Tax=Rapidithrix thailandica TaxID=413964 RepID=A0AAW9SI74_9BACT